MKKTLNINLGGLIFHIDEDAFNQLERYLGTLKHQFAKIEGGDEIVNDVEIRLAELFKEKTTNIKEVVTRKDVEAAIAVLGQPEDYIDDEQQESNKVGAYDLATYQKTGRKIFRDADNRVLGGVASGLAAYFNIDALWMRLIFIGLLFAGFGVLLYLILWVVVPKAKSTADKLQMRGEPVTLSNIEKAIKDEAAQVSQSIKSFSQGARSVARSGPSRIGQFIQDLGTLLVNAIKLVFSLIFKLIGFALLAFGFVVLLALIIALISGSVEVNGLGYSLADIQLAIANIAPTPGHYQAFLIGIALLTLPPLILLVYLGIRLLFQVNPLQRQVRYSLAFLVLVGLGLTIYTSIRTGMQFRRQASHTVSQVLPTNNGHLHLALLQDKVYTDFESFEFRKPWIKYADEHAISAVNLHLHRSNTGKSYLETEVTAMGLSRQKANRSARQLEYSASVDTGKVSFPLYFLLPQNEKFRSQEVHLNVFLKPGDTLFLAPEIGEILTQTPNLLNYWSFEMPNHYWVMTKAGLMCTDCPEAYAEPEESEEELEIEEDNDVKENQEEENDTAVETPKNSEIETKKAIGKL